MFRWVHIIDSFASLVRHVCHAICNVFHCPEHFESEEK